MIDTQLPQTVISKRGRPRRGTQIARTAALINAATRVFLREGYGLASIDKVAAEAGVSTRTIYERYKNKADLLGAVISRLVDRMSAVLATAELNRLEPRAALALIAETIVSRARDPDAAALFRIVATEAHRFPELAAKMRENNKQCGQYGRKLSSRASRVRSTDACRSGSCGNAVSANDLRRAA